MNKNKYLEKNYIIREYKIQDVYKSNIFSTIYTALDYNLEQKVFIQEYFPLDISYRDESGTIRLKKPDNDILFESGLNNFLNKAKIQATFFNPNLQSIRQFFRRNGTAYLVMSYEDGQTLESVLISLKQEKESISEEDIKMLLVEISNGLSVLHSKNILHGNISPENIFLTDQGRVLLTNFSLLHNPTYSEYMPIEEYQKNNYIKGEWSDIYSLGCVLYKCISPYSTLINSEERVYSYLKNKKDPLISIEILEKDNYTKKILKLINWMLKPIPSDRPKKVSTVIDFLKNSSSENSSMTINTSPRQDLPNNNKKPFHLIISIIGGVIISSSLLMIFYKGNSLIVEVLVYIIGASLGFIVGRDKK